MKASGKRFEALAAELPLVEAAETAVRARLRAVARLLARAGDRLERDAEYAHAIRTTARRAQSGLDAFESVLEASAVRRARKALKRLRRAAAPVRECDVHAETLREFAGRASGRLRAAAEHAMRQIDAARRDAVHGVLKYADRHPRRWWRRLAREVRGLKPTPAETLGPLARQVVSAHSTQLHEAATGPMNLGTLHDLRLCGKRLRYAAELFANCLGPAAGDACASLTELQDLLGRINDAHQIAERLAHLSKRSRRTDETGLALADALRLLAERFAALRDARIHDAARRLTSTDSDNPVLRTRDALSMVFASPPATTTVRAEAPALASSGPRRLAAIDVGTNSIRLIVVEAHGDGIYRVLDDEKETTRLGAGLERTGAMSASSIARAADAVDRMRRIAEGYRAEAVRVIGTSACREASNTCKLADLIASRTGLTLEVISPEEEGRLAYVSAAHAFDLRDAPAAVVDIGGGSTEVVLAAGGAIERICSLPLGAVRMTERFGGPEACAGKEYRLMRRHVRRVIREAVGRPELVPQLVIGTGGTFTTLANILLHRQYGPGGPSLWDRGVPGHEAKRSEVRHVLDWLRSLTPRELARVPGLPPERTDIIVAGLTIAERLLKHLGTNVVHVHDRGIRDGIVIKMAAELFAARRLALGERPDPMAAVRRFAEACRYEAGHSEHVTRLALSIHDQLAAAPGQDRAWALPGARRLLEAAGVLHDIGYLVNYSKHHKHGYHLIVHSGLSGFTARELLIVANLAYYHRQSEPSRSHPNFNALDRADRELVRRLAAILRVADGLDRTHTRQVHGVMVRVSDGAVEFSAESDEEPGTDLWGAERKSGLFRDVFGLAPRFRWAPTTPGSRVIAADAGPGPAAAPLAATLTQG
jgi:exopolyphosphatase/guanosine-5'-triphosphate,3'-diphosphate pyrophosphatase